MKVDCSSAVEFMTTHGSNFAVLEVKDTQI